jgi:hypothetical protein
LPEVKIIFYKGGEIIEQIYKNKGGNKSWKLWQ